MNSGYFRSVGTSQLAENPSLSLPVMTSQMFYHHVLLGLRSARYFLPCEMALFLCSLSMVDIFSVMQLI